MDALTRRIRLLTTLILLLLPLVFFYKLVFTGMILARGDVYAYFYPYWQARNAALSSGTLPLWSPELFMGVPLLANSQVGTFYPPNWPLVPFDPPTGVAISLLAHITWALAGAYLLARRTVRLERVPALLAAAIFALGGYMGAKVENINQLQALAWMPWLFALFDAAVGQGAARCWALLLAVGLALQTLAGHPQTVFIMVVGLAVYGAVASFTSSARRASWRTRLRPALVLAAAGGGALLLASPQIIPMLELMGGSNRSGGLNPQQAMAFSLNPFVIGRGLLPSYDGLLFGEYVAYTGVIGLGLAILGIFNRISTERPEKIYRLPWIVLAVAGFGLALGLYNPLYWTLANLPGFSFFRVPARWLALFALAAAMLAGIGLQTLTAAPPRRRFMVLIVAIVAGLGAASRLTEQMAVDVIGPALPTEKTVIGWTIALTVLLAALTMRRASLRIAFLGAAALLELFLASRVLAYNEVVPPDTFHAQRFTISQLRAYADRQTPPGRVLSISGLLFDPGDRDSLIARYLEAGMSDLAIRIALVDTKMRETLAANLPLVWGVPSVDGFDGGLLPTGWYTQFTSLLLPPGELRTIDGRLREILAKPECRGACIPDARWLNLTHTRYLITDKVYDLWHEDVAYDTQFEIALQPGETTAIRAVPAFEADALNVLYTCPAADCRALAAIFYDAEGEVAMLTAAGESVEVGGFRLARLALPPDDAARAPARITLRAGETPVTVTAATLVDTRTGAFTSLTLGSWRRALSSDIKLYENLDTLPRAFVVHQALFVPDTWTGSEDALNLMRDPAFDPARTVIIAGGDDSAAPAAEPAEVLPANASIETYTPTHIEITANTDTGGWLVLTDAYFPGWQAQINGQAAPVYRADVMFRAVRLPAGKSRVVFTFIPTGWPWIFLPGAAAWLAAVLLWRKRQTTKTMSQISALYLRLHNRYGIQIALDHAQVSRPYPAGCAFPHHLPPLAAGRPGHHADRSAPGNTPDLL
ncbi:MAG: hypothetical protein DWB42_09785 [Chloroflexi bacterium]|nr:hypothetical protein [Chloroflexota bacterium]MDL1883565.1 YfhO family protein [Anaerolineae bacterium CFX8]